MIIAALLVAAAVVLVWRLRRPITDDTAPPPRAADRPVLDSLEAADARHDWVSALRWAENLGAVRPRDPFILLARATAWSNFSVEQRPGRHRPRPALRTSLERMACMRRALALMDSAANVADTQERWLDAGTRLEAFYETLGLPGDALVTCEILKERQPNAMGPFMRAYMLRALLYDPVHPDTSEYDRYLKSQGRR